MAIMQCFSKHFSSSIIFNSALHSNPIRSGGHGPAIVMTAHYGKFARWSRIKAAATHTTITC